MRRYLVLAIVLAFHACSAAAGSLGPDGTPGRNHPGKFIWFDLATEDPAASRAFYGAVFGWRFIELAGVPASYSLILNGNAKVGGIFRRQRPAGARVGSRWLPLISVRDAGKAAQVVRDRGGEVLLAPTLVQGRGEHAVFRDPDGAVFGVLATQGGDPPDTLVDDGDVFWLDLFTHDPSKAAAFYAAIAGYEVEVGELAGRSRTLLSSEGIARAGIARLPSGADKPGWLPYILVDDVPGTLARARRAGGRVVLEPRADLLKGNLAVIADPSGGVLGIVDWAGAE